MELCHHEVFSDFALTRILLSTPLHLSYRVKVACIFLRSNTMERHFAYAHAVSQAFLTTVENIALEMCKDL